MKEKLTIYSALFPGTDWVKVAMYSQSMVQQSARTLTGNAKGTRAKAADSSLLLI